MRLLDTETGQFVEADPAARETVYAILSHTWDTENGEQTYKELKKIQRRYDPGSQVPQSRPDVPAEGSASSSPAQDRSGSSPTPSRSHLSSRDSSLFTTPLTAPSGPSKSWFTRRMARLRIWHQRCSVRNAPQNASVPIPINTPSSKDAPTPSSHDPPPPASSDPAAMPPELQSKPPLRSIWDDPELSPKIRDACAVARENGYRYIWIDSCCIDKSSSSELSEAINSMYKWYAMAAVCYAYLADVPPGDDHQAPESPFRKSRWFTRGWTLQELIAPGWVQFLSKDWAPVGSKQALVKLVESVTNIDSKALLKLEPLDTFSVAQRLSWAATRETTREEDRAYSLLGIFDINMPTLYGEGDRAFRRLQEQIMQRIPDQSLFAWGDVYLVSQLPRSPDFTDTPKVLRADAWQYSSPQHPFAVSPDYFKRSERISTPRRDTIQSSASHRHKIEYTSTPYGICTQFPLIPLTRDLLLSAITHSEDVKLESLVLEDPPSLWYLAILGCEHAERPGHLLGRVCYMVPSESGFEFLYTGFIEVHSGQRDVLCQPDLFPLSPQTLEHCRPLIELKTVYMPHPDRADLPSRLQDQPYVAIKLMLLKETSDALRSQGYSADLGDPGADGPGYSTTQWLMLSNDEHTIAVEFQHTLSSGGKRFTIHAKVDLLGSYVQLDSASDSHQADGGAVSWSDGLGWLTTLDRKRVRLRAAGAGTLTVDLGLDFVGTGVYILRVDVLSDASPAYSASEWAAGQTGEVEWIEVPTFWRIRHRGRG